MAPPPLLRRRARPARALSLLAIPALALAAACRDPVATADPVASPEGLTLGSLQARAASSAVAASTANGPATLRTVVTLVNRGAWPLDVQYPACPLSVTGHRLAAHTDAPGFVYPSSAPFATPGVCGAALLRVTIAPGASHEFVAAVDLAALRATVPAGRWFLRASLQLDASIAGAPLRIAAGDVTL